MKHLWDHKSATHLDIFRIWLENAQNHVVQDVTHHDVVSVVVGTTQKNMGWTHEIAHLLFAQILYSVLNFHLKLSECFLSEIYW